MKLFRFPASSSSKAFHRFQATVQSSLSAHRLTRSMSVSEANEFRSLNQASHYGVWALKLTSEARNRRVWAAINSGDVAAFYIDKKFRYTARIVYKWISDSIESVAGWGAPESGTFSLAFALDSLRECELTAQEYCAIVGFKKVPVHSDFHNEMLSFELISILTDGLPKNDPGVDLDSEGALKYRIQRYRERSDGNRLRVLQEKGYGCEVCGFDLAHQFGNAIAPSAQVHHLNPLALGERQATSIDEFVVLCAACHTAAHSGKDRTLNPRTVNELRLLVRRRWDLLDEA